ncbi:hypothetical protein [Streptomyces sp. S.PB5]|uniref:hypothetical protein n=1 Tax=Streptomyces sp. S.PB5 TaxID=3020844 RepID=UPI0025B15CC1|nr:hypothetical protein [Streptomyces sp. S.PB5]MDN3028971.1 hypothetical protein [Streptomyces sp. S.PB5]
MPLAARTAVVVDDAIATGFRARAARRVVRARGAARLVLAVPVGTAEEVPELPHEVAELICLHATESVPTVRQWYEDFAEPSDDRVAALLARGRPTH